MASQTWTVKRILEWTRGYLERKGDEHPRLSAEWLISDVTGLSRVQIYMNFDKPLTPAELDAMHDAVVRRGRGEPLQYVTGEMPFRQIVLHCERGVLIPRPETEVLVDAALEGVDAATLTFPAILGNVLEPAEEEAAGDDDKVVSLQGNRSAEKDDAADAQAAELVAPAEPPVLVGPGCRVLEVGTGTGCIALSIASERPGTRVVATDLSPQAVALATRNRDTLGLEHAVTVVEGDLASVVDPDLMGTFSVLVSNPPYIPSAVVPTLPQEVIGYEPGLALDGGEDGLDVFRRILELAPRALAPGGMLCCELFEDNVGTAAELVRVQGGWASAEVREDLTHRPRVLVAVREG
ncbi:MAG: peptide chain release factor N(5)-glutamine methyltransferase [Olsenella sp.]|jgi:release factor glutamine methyltransferase|nr:peptide chain release factor N(5)-glutamine methyltransferase [Olsenella sp.]MCI1794063.1 peptide chain release factor N(5)-glutamine methyltransferase [Olsenella sp.]MCI1811696.1 peptide chain release factor N(5)-glutamine methyltransferase [Olsenella sp.]MCI1880320.1 peptide chain release factor N(5)-glutamine methyltransferase [Olsenella sp.]